MNEIIAVIDTEHRGANLEARGLSTVVLVNWCRTRRFIFSYNAPHKTKSNFATSPHWEVFISLLRECLIVDP